MKCFDFDFFASKQDELQKLEIFLFLDSGENMGTRN